MDSALVIIASLIVVVIAFCLRIYRPRIRGKLGEARVSMILSSLPDDYHIFNDVYLCHDGRSVQIDHVVISVYGIFVIETKNYTGWIYGSDKSEHWVKNMYGNKYYFQNPLKQNYSHVKVLQDLFGLSVDKFIPVVVFLRRATLKCETRDIVIYSSQLKYLICSHTDPVLDTAEVRRLASLLSSSLVVGDNVSESHVANVRQRLAQTDNAISSGICPRCGGKLVERRGRYGRFLGCSNYPRCKFTTRQ